MMEKQFGTYESPPYAVVTEQSALIGTSQLPRAYPQTDAQL